MLRRLTNWLISLGGSWHPVRVVTRASCSCGYRGPYRDSERLAVQDAYDHQAMGGRAT